MLLDFEGLSRVLTIVARGYMWRPCASGMVQRAGQQKSQPKRGLAVSDSIFRFTRGIPRIGG